MKVLLIIDMLEDFFQDGLLRDNRRELVAGINALSAAARDANLPVIWIRQEFRHDLEDAFLAMRKRDIRITIAGTPGAEILSDLDRDAADFEIVKKRYSAFHGTELDRLLSDLDASELILAGVNSHACIRTTAIDAYQRDLEVIIPKDCVASNDTEHHEVTLNYLSREIASVAALEQILATI